MIRSNLKNATGHFDPKYLMSIEIYATDDQSNKFANLFLISRLETHQEFPASQIVCIAANIVAALKGGDYSIHGMWFDGNNPEEMIFSMTQRFLLGRDSPCWLYHMYTDDFKRLRKNEIYHNHLEIPCHIPIIL